MALSIVAINHQKGTSAPLDNTREGSLPRLKIHLLWPTLILGF